MNDRDVKSAFLVKVNKLYKRIDHDEIQYLESNGKYVDVCFNQRKYNIRTSIKKIMPSLTSSFVRIHNSFVLNIDKIETIDTDNKVVTLENGSIIPFSRGYKENLFESFIIG